MDRVCGLDVHKDSVFACILDEQGKKILEKRFGTLTPDLDKLRDTIVEHNCCRVAMESTSIYWMPIWRILDTDFSVKLANPYFTCTAYEVRVSNNFPVARVMLALCAAHV